VSTDNCFVVDSPQNLLNCNVTPPYQTQVKFFVVYPVPWWGIQASATFQSLPGPQITATYTATNAEIAPSLGRNLASGAAGTVTMIPFVAPGTLFGEQLNQVDFRGSKTFTLPGGRRVQALIDLYNLFNANPVLALNNTYGSQWQRPTQILQGRLLKFGFQLDF